MVDVLQKTAGCSRALSTAAKLRCVSGVRYQPQNTPTMNAGCNAVCDQSIHWSAFARSAGFAFQNDVSEAYLAPRYLKMACDSQTTTPESSITGTRPCGFMARNSGVSRPPNEPPSSTCLCAMPSSPTSHITFCKLNDDLRP